MARRKKTVNYDDDPLDHTKTRLEEGRKELDDALRYMNDIKTKVAKWQGDSEEFFTEGLVNAIEEFGKMLKAYFRTLNDKHLETLLLISMAMFLGTGNIYQVTQVLGISKTTSYHRVKNVSVYSWRQLLQYRLL